MQQAYELPDVSLSVATANTVVMVRPTDLIAAEQIKAQEKQRLIRVIPNFYTSYIYNAAPLTSKQKFSLAARGTFGPVALIGVAFGASIEQANNSFADGRSSDFLTHAVFPALFHQDPRYYFQGSGSVKSRLVHAVSSAFVTRSDSWRTAPNYSFLLGDLCAGALRAAVGLAGRVGGNLLRVFPPTALDDERDER